MSGTDQSPGEWSWTATRGDSLMATAFTIEQDGSPLVPSAAVAQVRESRSRSATKLLDLTCDIASNTVTVGDGDDLDDLTPGVYWWDLEITATGYASGLTVVGGSFRVLDDVTESA